MLVLFLAGSSFTPTASPRASLSTVRSAAPVVMSEVPSRRAVLAGLLGVSTLASPAYAKGKNSVSFANVKDGAIVPGKFTYKFEVTGYELSPAAAGLVPGTGHHHLVIDGPGAFVPKGEAIPFDATHKHFGKAQTEGELELAPGKHKLTLQLANHLHESYGKEFAKTITVEVKETVAMSMPSGATKPTEMDCS